MSSVYFQCTNCTVGNYATTTEFNRMTKYAFSDQGCRKHNFQIVAAMGRLNEKRDHHRCTKCSSVISTPTNSRIYNGRFPCEGGGNHFYEYMYTD